MGLNGIFTYPESKSVYNGGLERDLNAMSRNFYALMDVLYVEQEKMETHPDD
jgi:hypothetical protein